MRMSDENYPTIDVAEKNHFTQKWRVVPGENPKSSLMAHFGVTTAFKNPLMRKSGPLLWYLTRR